MILCCVPSIVETNTAPFSALLVDNIVKKLLSLSFPTNTCNSQIYGENYTHMKRYERNFILLESCTCSVMP